MERSPTAKAARAPTRGAEGRRSGEVSRVDSHRGGRVMNGEALAAFGEIAGAIAVVVSQPFRDFAATLESDPTYLRTRAFARSETGQLRDE